MSAKKSGEMMKGDDSPTGEMKNKFVKILEIMAWPMVIVAFLISSGLQLVFFSLVRVAIPSMVCAALFFMFVVTIKGAESMQGESDHPMGTQFIWMFELVIWPCMVMAYLLNSGLYDIMV